MEINIENISPPKIRFDVSTTLPTPFLVLPNPSDLRSTSLSGVVSSSIPCNIFTWQDIQQYTNNCNEKQSYLSKDVYESINILDKVIFELSQNVSNITTSNEHTFQHRNQVVVRKNIESVRRSTDTERTRKHTKNVVSEEWKALKASSTVVKTTCKEGIEKDMNELRMILNKITNKNYDTQKDHILDLIKKCQIHQDIINNDSKESEDISTDTSYMNKIGQFIFDIASTNKFYGEVYAELYQALIQEYRIFEIILQEFVQSFQTMIKKIEYADPNVNYDAYCEYIKLNDKRRATTSFLAILMNRSVLSETTILDFIQHFQHSLNIYVNKEGHEDEVNEITELLYLLILLSKDCLQNHPTWKDEIIPEVISYSNKKAKDYQSLSSRSIFKFKDILKIVNA
jgi:hypothetical protein